VTLRSRTVRISILAHVAAVVLVALAPGLAPWVVAAVFADHLLLLWASLWPRSRLIGPNLRRLPAEASTAGAVALTFDDGPDPEVTPEVLSLLRARGARATFFCIGRRAAAHPELIRRMIAEGHAVENHTHDHPSAFCVLHPRALAAEIDRAQAVLTRTAGAPPRYFRAPAGLRNPWLDPLLAARRLSLVSWTRRAFDTRTTDAARVVARLCRGIAAGDVLLLHDGSSARGPSGRPVVLEALGPLLDELERRDLRSVALPEATPLRSDAAERPGARRRLASAVAEMHVRLRTEADTPWRQAASVGLGTLIGCLPVYGLHLALCVVTARLLRLNRITTYLAAHVNNPLSAPPLIAAELWIGHLLLYGARPDPTWDWARPAWILGLTGALFAGSVAVGAALGLMLGLVAYGVVRRWRAPSLTRNLIEATARRYLPCGIFAWEFVRGKLRHDPAYLDVLASGRLPRDCRLVDLGCGRGILIALLDSARRLHDEGRWDPGLPAPPETLEATGIEHDPATAAQARAATVPPARIEVVDLAASCPPPCNVAVLFDALHYLRAAEQEALLGRVARALEPGGLLLLREADTTPAWRFRVTHGAERLCALARREWRRPFHFRSSREWCALIEAQGLTTRVRPMSAGTAYSNVLIEARKPAPLVRRPSSSENSPRSGTMRT